MRSDLLRTRLQLLQTRSITNTLRCQLSITHHCRIRLPSTPRPTSTSAFNNRLLSANLTVAYVICRRGIEDGISRIGRCSGPIQFVELRNLSDVFKREIEDSRAIQRRFPCRDAFHWSPYSHEYSCPHNACKTHCFLHISRHGALLHTPTPNGYTHVASIPLA